MRKTDTMAYVKRHCETERVHRRPPRRWPLLATTVLVCCACLFEVSAWGQGEGTSADYSAELPRIPPVEPSDALATFQVIPGYHMELAAAEPLVASPIAVDWDEQGRMFVVEMRGYAENRKGGLSRIRCLIDRDQDGRYDESTVFVDGLLWPTALACWDGGLYVADAPRILFCQDTNGDGTADVQREVFTGFGIDNVQGLLNTLLWHFDNRFYGATSTNPSLVRGVARGSESPLDLRGRDFSFEPTSLFLRAESGGGQHGASFDDWGNRFVCSNSDHAQQVVLDDRYLARNPRLLVPATRVSIATDGPQAEVFRASPVEPWRIVRTRLRVAGAVPGPIEGGGRPAGYFTGATGITIVRGDAFPTEWRDMMVVGDAGGNIVHRKKLRRTGVEFTAERVDDHCEFVASKDIWFRPVQFANGPDGGLYVIDMYREVIEHPDSLPEVIKRHLDLTSGRERGRIYRIVPDDYVRRPIPRLDRAGVADLVALLDHPNAWHRATAGRLLYQRRDPSCPTLLIDLLKASSTGPLGRISALHLLATLDHVPVPILLDSLASEHPEVRRQAIQLAEGPANDVPSIAARLMEMVHDPSPPVRLQLACSLGELPLKMRVAPLVAILEQDGQDHWIRLACVSSLRPGAGEALGELLRRRPWEQGDQAIPLVTLLAAQLRPEDPASEIQPVLEGLAGLPPGNEPLAAQMFLQLESQGIDPSGLAIGQGYSDQVAKQRERVVAWALQASQDRKAASRVAAIRGLTLAPQASVTQVAAELLSPAESREVQAATLAVLDHLPDPDAAAIILDAWPTLTPETRREATTVLIRRPARCTSLLDAIERQDVSLGQVDPATVAFLRDHPDATTAARAQHVFRDRQERARDEVVQAYHTALERPGDPLRGKGQFDRVCAVCHQAGTATDARAATSIAPNLAAVASRGAEAILLAILDPNREVNPQYEAYIVVTRDGRTTSGMIAAESPTGIRLQRADGQTELILRSDTDEIRSTGQSLMPVGLESELNPADMADLLAYILSLSQTK